jgi:hypothetical protein
MLSRAAGVWRRAVIIGGVHVLALIGAFPSTTMLQSLQARRQQSTG